MLDAGTGARDLGRDLFSRSTREIDVLFTHFHMDHVFGFPFFGPVYAPGYQVRVNVPAFSAGEARERLARYSNGVYHPVRLREMPADLSFTAVQPGRAFERGPFRITAVRLNHPGGSVGYRIEAGESVFVYITDTAPLAAPGEGAAAGQPPNKLEQALLAAMQDADLVVFDTMFSFDEYLEKMTWGHSYPEYAVELCKVADVKHLVLFHHAPDASDDELDEQAAQWTPHREPLVTLAREGDVLDLEG
ncbi:MAG: MBL fold metallo-hydrolase [Proteobacteria bacterium]|nr:MBL fold metallo-hydrolase [Pseudomonadota bacterium]MCP4917030.1 MBL fold metallo-hydrolase [Pseudomonadota bacterium]